MSALGEKKGQLGLMSCIIKIVQMTFNQVVFFISSYKYDVDSPHPVRN